MKEKIEKLKKFPKFYYISGIIILIVILTVAIPSLARYKNRNAITPISLWSGDVATAYHSGSGTETDPYVISTGSELAYFSDMLKTTDYLNTYFILNNDILLNDGVFKYENNQVTYIKPDKTLYLKKGTTELYEDSAMSRLSSVDMNVFPSLNNFKGHFDGDYYTIYGLYVSNQESEESALFTNLGGDIENLFVRNSLVTGGSITSGIASSANSSTIKNILYDGYVLGSEDTTEQSYSPKVGIADQSLGFGNTKIEVDISSLIKEIEEIDGLITTATLTGTCSNNSNFGGGANVSINGESIGKCNKNGITFTKKITDVSSNTKLTITSDFSLGSSSLKNLKYTVKYKKGLTAGIVAKGNNLNLENVINKGAVKAENLTAGIVAKTTNLTMKNSYNNAKITASTSASGLVGKITNSDQTVEIAKSYNTGEINATNKSGLVGIISNNTEQVYITDSFQTSNTNAIDTVSNTNVTVNNSYRTNGELIRNGNVTGDFTLTDNDSIKNNITFNNYVSNEDYSNNKNNIWVSDKTDLPVIFIDNVLESNVIITVGSNTWNNLSFDLEKTYYNDKLAFSITEKSIINPVKEIYYYLSDKELTKSEISNITDWTRYNNVTAINEEGTYIIYVKTIDYKDNIDYSNTGILVLDKTAPTAEITYANHTWNSNKTDVKNVYIDSDISLEVKTNDSLSGLADTSYYISDKALSLNEINALTETDWKTYKEAIKISNRKITILYVKTTDNSKNTTIVNSDYIVYEGYEQSKVSVSNEDLTSKESISISDKSSITFTYIFENNDAYQAKYTRNLIVNNLLPEKTKITIQDTNNHKTYTYKISNSDDSYNYENSCSGKDLETCEKVAKYPFTLFNEVGTTETKKYTNQESTNIRDAYKVTLDFSQTTITENKENIYAKLQIIDEKDEVIYSTLSKTIKKFSIISNSVPSLSITSSYNSDIVYNSDSVVSIPLTSKLTKQDGVYDSTYQNKIMGIAVKMIDDSNKTVAKKYLKNLEFMIGDKSYFPDNDGIVRINLNNGLKEFNSDLKIITSKSDTKLPSGTYKFEITSYLANDGKFSTLNSTDKVTIPVLYEKEYNNTSYSFKVTTGKENKILNRKQDVSMNFAITKSGVTTPTVRVSLYKKSIQSAYDKSYDLINLNKYASNSFTEITYNNYLVLNDTLNLNLLTTKLPAGGYKLLFELYDEDKKVGEIPYKFIVK